MQLFTVTSNTVVHMARFQCFSNERSFLVYILLEAPQRPKERIPQPHVPYFYLLRPNFAKIWNLWDFGFFKWIPRARACTRGSSEFTHFSSVFEKSSKMEDRGRRLFHYILWGFTEGFRVSFHNIYKNAMLVLGTFQPALRFFFNFHITPRARACTRVHTQAFAVAHRMWGHIQVFKLPEKYSKSKWRSYKCCQNII